MPVYKERLYSLYIKFKERYSYDTNDTSSITSRLADIKKGTAIIPRTSPVLPQD